MFRLLFLLFLVVPIVELFVLIEVGDVIGAGWTVLLVIGTAVLGAYLVKLQGLQTLQRAQLAMQQGQPPAMEMLEGAALFISGFLLLIPGFVTDAIGFALLIPSLRRSLLMPIIANSKMVFRSTTSQRHRSTSDDVIEGEIVEDDENRHLR